MFLDPFVRLLLDDPAPSGHDGGCYPAPMVKMLVGGIDDGVGGDGGQIIRYYINHLMIVMLICGSLWGGMRHNRAFALAVLPLVLSSVLGGDFGEASATGRATSSGNVEVTLSVVVNNSPTVVAHVIDPGGDQTTVPLVHRGNNRYSSTIELRPADFIVVFEALGDALSTQSQPVRLTELGLDPSLIGVLATTTTAADRFPSGVRQWGWAGLALAALSLALVAWWALPERRRRIEAEGAPSEP